MRRRRSPWALAMARDTWLDLRFALMATMTIIPMPARLMGITGRATLSAVCSSAQAPGITTIMDGAITGVLTMAVGTTAVDTTAGEAGTVTVTGDVTAAGTVTAAGAMAIGEATTAGDAATVAGATGADSTAGGASMVVVAGSTVVEESKGDMAGGG